MHNIPCFPLIYSKTKLVFSAGHLLGGAVAQTCTADLLQSGRACTTDRSSLPWHSVQVARPAGHSLGGAVAQLCALDLLQAAGAGAPPDVSCVGFATPAVGNAALAAHIAARGWGRRFVTYLLPGDSCVAVK